jgi:flagellar biosynthesis/type III secretory pathway protein FliH
MTSLWLLTEQEQIMEIVTSWMKRGIEQGLEKGLEKGLKQGAQRATTLVVRQLTRRINGLSPSLEARVRQLSIEEVEALAEALLDFSSETDLINWLAQHQN